MEYQKTGSKRIQERGSTDSEPSVGRMGPEPSPETEPEDDRVVANPDAMGAGLRTALAEPSSTITTTAAGAY